MRCKNYKRFSNIKTAITVLVVFMPISVLLSSCSSTSTTAGSSFSCWPTCSQKIYPMLFGVAPATFTMGNYLGVKPTSYPSNSQIAKELAYLKGSHSLFVHFYISYRSGLSSDMALYLKELFQHGYSINLALRYIPKNSKIPDPVGFANWVSQVIKELPFVKVFQITNEANATSTSDSDGYYPGAKHALVYAMKKAAKARKPSQLIGFNWSYSPDTTSDLKFFESLENLGGKSFIKSVNFVGIDLYPDTYFPSPSRDASFSLEISNALSLLRNKLMPTVGWGKNEPIFIQEISWPTINQNDVLHYNLSNFAQHFLYNFFGQTLMTRTPSDQAQFLKQAIVEAREYGVALFQWFSLTDANTPLGDGWGLFYPNGKPKPAAKVFKAAVAFS